MKILAIFDNEGETIDRYTVVTDAPHSNGFLMMLGLSEDGDAYSQWGGGQYNREGDNAHLGERVQFEDLSEATQRHIAQRVFGD